MTKTINILMSMHEGAHRTGQRTANYYFFFSFLIGPQVESINKAKINDDIRIYYIVEYNKKSHFFP